jgi:outer membrane murein-binding lipoprotein Lpp
VPDTVFSTVFITFYFSEEGNIMKHTGKVIGLVGAAILLLVFLGSCTQGISMDEADEIRSDVQGVIDRVAELESSIDSMKAEDVSSDDFSTILSELGSISSRLEDIGSRLVPPEPEPIEGEMTEPMAPEQPAF